MFFNGITVNEHDDLFFGDAIFADKPGLAMFRYKKENKTIVHHKYLNNDIKIQVPQGVF